MPMSSSNNVGKAVVIFPHISGETLGALVRLVRTTKDNKSLKLLRYKILIYLISGMLGSFRNISRDF